MLETGIVDHPDVEGPDTSGATVTRRQKACEHLAWIVAIAERLPAFCAECVGEGKEWVSLRACLTCGHVSCGADSPADHAAQHYAETDHPVVALAGSHPPSRWCYPDGRFV